MTKLQSIIKKFAYDRGVEDFKNGVPDVNPYGKKYIARNVRMVWRLL